MLWFLRKKKVLFAIFLVALLYFVIATFGKKPRVVLEEDTGSKLEVNLLELIESPDDASPDGAPPRASGLCKNSVQGKLLIADDRGNVCDRSDVDAADGCCRPDGASTELYSCHRCEAGESGCCAVYEHCVSCCMRPLSAAVLRRGLDSRSLLLARAPPVTMGGGGTSSSGNATTASGGGGGGGSNNVNKVYALVRSRFDLCLTRCRTSSLSVRHENAYADAARKHCFGVVDAAVDDV